MMELVYEDDELQAFWLQGQSTFALISFGDLISLANGKTFSIQGPAAKLGLTCLGIMAKRPNWYPRANLERLWSAVSHIVDPYNERVLYGASMGGHGAAKSSLMMRATTTIALCPQWSIDPKDKGSIDLGWREYFNDDLMSGMAIKADDVHGAIFIFSDPGEKRDSVHRQKIQTLSADVFPINTHFCDHNVTPVLSGTNNLRDIINLCRAQNIVALKAFVNRTRRPHFFRKKALIERGLSKKAGLTLKVTLRLVAKDPLVLEIAKGVSAQLRRLAKDYADTDVWYNFVVFLIVNETNLTRKFSLSMLLPGNTQLRYSLFTVFETQVFYDPSANRLVHTTAGLEDPTLLGVKLYLHNDRIEIFAENRFCRIALPELSSLEGTQDVVFEPVKTSGDWMALRRNGLFLSADPSGFLSCDRTQASQWEFFKIEVTSERGSIDQAQKNRVPTERASMALAPFVDGLKASNTFPNDLEKEALTERQKANGITICAIAKNEGRYIEEWIAYHLALNVDRIIVYSNDTEDSQNEKLEEISRADPRVTWKEWPSKVGVSPQISAYNDVLPRISTPWIAFIDIDEFLVPQEAETIQEWLATVPEDVSSVHINWRGFGSSGVENPNYDLVTRTFIMAAPVGWGNHHHFKTIARSKFATEAFIHNIATSVGRRTLSDFRDFEMVNNGLSNRIVYHKIQLNHYQCKTFQEFSARMRRGDANVADGPRKIRDASAERFKQLDLNDEENLAIRKFDKRVDEKLEWIKGLTARAS